VSDLTFLDWPFFDAPHRAHAAALGAWCTTRHTAADDHGDVDSRCRGLVAALGKGGWLRHAVVAPHGGQRATLDVRTLCLSRDILARHDALADFAFAMQGLGAGPISLFGSDELRTRWLPKVASGEAIAAFALSVAWSGGDVGCEAYTGSAKPCDRASTEISRESATLVIGADHIGASPSREAEISPGS
jgi:acyl-CoA dehydrogenase